MRKKTMKKGNLIIRVKGGLLEISPVVIASGYEEFAKVCNEEADKYAREGNLVECESAECDKKVMVAFDRLFGRGACEKVFGKGVVPDWNNMNEFLDKLEALCKKRWR